MQVSACSHLYKVLDPETRGKVIAKCIKVLKPHLNKFDAIAVCGYSMALIGPSVADAIGKPIIIVRKSNRNTASQFPVEGVVCNRYIIIDDLICSGTTINRVIKKIKEEHNTKAKLVGIYLYTIEQSSYYTNRQIKETFGAELYK